jgi:hypothetical protein
MIHDNLTIFDDKVVCPRCDGNGFIYRAIVQPLDKTILLCDECEAIWNLDDHIDKSTFQDFTSYVTSLGYPMEHITLESIDYNWYEAEPPQHSNKIQ